MVACSSGCTILSYQKCSKVKGHPEEKVEMTYERISTVVHNGCTLKLQYRPHENKSLLIGPIIPIIPTFGRMAYDLGTGERWIEIVNDGKSGTAVVKKISVEETQIDCSISTAEFYHEEKQYKFSEAPDNLLELKPSESISILLPNKETVIISIEFNSEKKDIKVKDVLRFNYHLVTV